MTNAYARNAMKTGVQAGCPGRPARTTWPARMPFMRRDLRTRSKTSGRVARGDPRPSEPARAGGRARATARRCGRGVATDARAPGDARSREEGPEPSAPRHEAGGGHPAIGGGQREGHGAGIRELAGSRAIEQATPARREVWEGTAHDAEQRTPPRGQVGTPQHVEVPGVTAEQLVATVAGQTDRHVPAREPRYDVRGERRGIRERLVENAHDALDPPVRVGSDDAIGVVRADRLGDAAGMRCLIEPHVAEADGKRARLDRGAPG